MQQGPDLNKRPISIALETKLSSNSSATNILVMFLNRRTIEHQVSRNVTTQKHHINIGEGKEPTFTI